MKYTKCICLLGIILFFWQCEIKVDEYEPTSGDADFTTYVAIGDSYSAGYTDGALGRSGQLFSFPNILAGQLAKVGMTSEFKQPLTPEAASVGTTVIDQQGHLNGYFTLTVINGSLSPVPTLGDASVLSTSVSSQGPFNNVGVPGAKSYHLVAPGFGNPANGAGNYNPFYYRFASNPINSTVLGDALLCEPTFFSLWIGGNDVLAYALAGGEADAITNPILFGGYVGNILQTLKSTAGFGAIANIPDINTLPYFNTVKYNALKIDQATANLLNNAYAQYNLIAEPDIVFQEGYNAFVISDPDMAMPEGLKFRQIKSHEKILLNIPQDSIRLKGWGSQKPIPAKYILDGEEISDIQEAVVAYNTILAEQAEEFELALVDMNGVMLDLNDGKIIDGVNYSTSFVTGNVFSLDGIHATARGSALIANEFIEAINHKYGSSIPKVNLNDYPTVVFP